MSVQEVRINGPHYATDYNGDGSGLSGIVRSGISAGTPNEVVINDGAGLFSSVAALGVAQGGTGLTTTAADSVFTTNGGGTPSWTTTLPASVLAGISHSGLSDLGLDSHTQYALLAGRSTGQTLIGGTGVSDDLTLQSTSNVTRGRILMNDPASVNEIDALTATTMSIGSTTATKVEIGKTAQTVEILGQLDIEATIDTATATTMFIGPATASAVEIADTGIITSVLGDLLIESALDTTSATVMTIGATTATSVEIGAVGTTTNIKGDLVVDGTTTTISSSTVTFSDNFLSLNKDYTAVVAETGGLTVNYLPTATSDTAAGGGFTAATTVATTGAATFSVNDIIQISSAADVSNDGLFVVSSHAANVLTISTTVYGWNQTQFTVSADNVAVITKINLSVIRTNASGDWEIGKGSVVPITYNEITTAPQMWEFQPVNGSFAATTLSYITIGYFAFDLPSLDPVISFVVTYHVDYVDRALDIEIWDGSSSIGSDLAVASTGIRTFNVTIPVVDKKLEVRIRKTAGSGTSPIVSSVQFVLNA